MPPDSKRLYWIIPYAASAFAVVVLVMVGLRWTKKARMRPAVAVTDDDSDSEPRTEYDDMLDDELKKLE